MAGANPEYWPFSTVPPEQRTELHKQLFNFLEEAFQNGFHPCKYMDGEYLIGTPDGRSGLLLYRGRLGGTTETRWEIGLNEEASRVLSFWVDDFDTASSSVLQWVRGSSTPEILALADGHIIRGPSLTEPAVLSSL